MSSRSQARPLSQLQVIMQDSHKDIDADTDQKPDDSKSELPAKKSAFLSYPTSTLSPAIVPTDLTNFKSRGISGIQKETAQKMT